jgi:hypothetical protein
MDKLKVKTLSVLLMMYMDNSRWPRPHVRLEYDNNLELSVHLGIPPNFSSSLQRSTLVHYYLTSASLEILSWRD